MRARPTADDVVVNSHLVQKRYDFYGADTEGSPTRYVSNSGTIAAASVDAITTGTAQTGSSNTLTLASGASDVDGIFVGMTISLASGAGSEQERDCTAYNGTTKVATVSPRWRTNLLEHSDDLSQAEWTKSNATITTDAYTAADGTTADKLVENTASSSHLVRNSTTLNSSTTYVASVKAKTAGRSVFTMIFLDNGSTFRSAHFDLLAGTVTVGNEGLVGEQAIYSLGNDEFLCVLIATTTGAPASSYVDYRMSDGSPAVAGDSYIGDGSSGIYFWNAQVEAAATLGDYIATTSAAITLPDATTVYSISDPDYRSAVLASTASTTDGEYVGNQFVTTGCTGSGQDRSSVTHYDGGLKLAVLSTALDTALDTTTTYKLIDRGY